MEAKIRPLSLYSGDGSAVVPLRTVTQDQPEADSAQSIREIVNMVLFHKYIIISVGLVVFFLSALVIFNLKPFYKSEVALLLNSRSSGITDIHSLLPSRGMDSGSSRSEIDQLQTPALIRQVITRLNLLSTPDFASHRPAPAGGIMQRVQNLFGGPAERAAPPGPDMAEQANAADMDDAEMAAAVDKYLHRLMVVSNDRSLVVLLQVKATDPKLAALIANTHAQMFVDAQKAAKQEAIGQADASISNSLRELELKAGESAAALEAYRTENHIVSESDAGGLSKQLQDVSTQLATARADLGEKEARLAHMQHPDRSFDGASSSEALGSATIQHLREQEATLMLQRSDNAIRLSDNHPTIVALDAQLRQVRRDIAGQVARITQQAAGDVAVARQKLTTLEESQRQLSRQALTEGAASRKLDSYELRAKADQVVLDNYLQRFKEISVQGDLQSSNAQIISPAVPAFKPAWLPRSVQLAGAFIVSAILAIAFGVALGVVEPGFRYIHQFERMTGVPGLGIAPALSRRQLVNRNWAGRDRQTRNSHYEEKIRFIGSRIDKMLAANSPRMILITSSLPNEGKSTFTVSLAQVLAQDGHRVLIVDTDLRRPSLRKLLKSDRGALGLGALLRGEARIEDVTQTDPFAGFDYITTESAAARSPALISAGVKAGVFQALRQQYDFVLLDSPPVAAVSDAFSLSRTADATIMVVRWLKTPRSAVKSALRELRENDSNVIGAVMTAVDVAKAGAVTPRDFDYYLKTTRQYYGLQ